ncbi:MAG: GNAT family N-acetyltransferase [Candidatus Hydrogenedentota bacterium]|jgi:predicted acetyltransferase|uniref:Acetyltransferase, GNAT family n=1 Tax=Sumerlaea chitinivorans TaxID=2250252 RepID=A0A2Z4Y4V9_SUMC1|nr:acetyltransferase, GNAT family [Candidatus Sumerlaea chitinivorans]RMH26251.1 MAG: GNAT family N-acetyltransferase [Candidatus Hydrogenedentota bacterium]GIX44984.1 MAG: hypothetical protein KatS3mg130_1392 [Candidatus Sumerlaea sp.]
MREIRTLDQSELPKLAALYKNAYRIDSATAAKWLENVCVENTRAIVDEHRVLSVIQILPYRVNIGGWDMAMGGIGGVATWADAQGHGYAGELMRASVREMYEREMPVSFLYPFSYRYYGKFGWTLAARRVVYTGFTHADLVRERNTLPVRAVLTDEDFTHVQTAYKAFLPQYNCLVARSAREWEQMRKRLTEDRVHCYLIGAQDGAPPAGYFVCEDQPVEGGYETVVRELVCLDDQAYTAAFSFLATLPTNVRRITIGHAEKPSLWRYFKEPFLVTRVDPYFQARVVDVKRACEQRGYRSNVRATVRFAIYDEIATWNKGPWELDVADGHARIQKVGSDPEVELSIQQFSAVFVGFQDPVEWVELGCLPKHCMGAAQRLRDIFHDKPTSLLDFF